MNAMLDLFDAPIVPGLALGQDIILHAEEAELLSRIAETGLNPFRFQQWTGKRLTRSFGWSFDFESGRFAPADPIPDWLGNLKTRAARFAKIDPSDLVQALLIRYDPGAGIGWHKDRPVFEHVVASRLAAPPRSGCGGGSGTASTAPRPS